MVRPLGGTRPFRLAFDELTVVVVHDSHNWSPFFHLLSRTLYIDGTAVVAGRSIKTDAQRPSPPAHSCVMFQGEWYFDIVPLVSSLNVLVKTGACVSSIGPMINILEAQANAQEKLPCYRATRPDAKTLDVVSMLPRMPVDLHGPRSVYVAVVS